MNYKDIPKFTKSGSYSVNFELFKYFVWHIEKEIKEGLVLNPDFQRGNVWTEEQQIAYIEFLLRGGESGRDFYFNAPSWPSVWDDGTYVCVDGLQRITSIMRFYNNEIKAFGLFYREFEGNPSTYVTVHVNNLKTRKEVLQWYIEMNSGGTVHSESEIKRVKKLLAKEQ